MRFFQLLIISLCLQTGSSVSAATHDETISQTKSVTLYYFWSRYCPHCDEARPFIQQLAQQYSWLQVHSYDLVDNRNNQQRFLSMAGQLGQPANSVPAFIFCGQMMVGYDHAETTGKELENQLLACHNQGNLSPAQQEKFRLPGIGQVHYQDFSLPVFTLIIAALDAFNPCAFFILFFLLSLLVHHRSRPRMLAVGVTFVIFSGLMYFLFMSAWLNLFLISEQLTIITAAAGLVAVLFGLINIKDYFHFNQGLSLSMSEQHRNKLFRRIRLLTQTGSWPAMLGATILLAIAANTYELLCTAGLPMIYTRILTLNALSSSEYYLYLALYNVIYIIPLLLIVIGFTCTLGSKKISENEGRLLKLLSGSMMLGLGIILLWKPEWLSNMLVSVAVIGFAVLVTLTAALWRKFGHSG